MSLQEVYKYCRPWAIAQEPPERNGALTPIAPYAVDTSAELDPSTGKKGGKLTSTCRASYNEGWSKDYSSKTKMTPTAGGGASDREPHDSLEAKTCIQHNKCHGGRTDYKEEMSIYQQASDRKALARHHRHCEQARLLPHNVREARWYKCFRQWEGQWEHREDSQTRVTGTDFSVLPAGYMPKGGHLPQRQRHILERYGTQRKEDEAEQAAAPSTKKASSNVGGAVQEEPTKAWAQKDPPEGKLGKENEAGRRQKGFGAWTRAAKEAKLKGSKLKGANYIKAPIPNWLKNMPTQLKQSDLLAALKSADKGDVKYFNNHHETVPLEDIFR